MVKRAAAARLGVSTWSPPWRHGGVATIGPRFLLPVLVRSLSEAAADHLLRPARAATSFELAAGHPWNPGPAGQPFRFPTDLHQAFAAAIAPAAQTAATRASYDGPWLALLVFAIAHRQEHRVLPVSTALLQAFVSYLVAADLSASSIRRYIQAVKDQHTRRGVPFPVPVDVVSRWNRALSRYAARPRPQIEPVTPAILRDALIRFPPRTPQDEQDTLATALATVTGCRTTDAINLDVCDFLLEYDRHLPGTAAFRIWGGKTDIARKGHFPRVGRPRDLACDIVGLLLGWCARHHLVPSPECSKRVRPAAQCTACGTLFRRLAPDGTPRPTSDIGHPWSTSDLTAAVRRTIARTGRDPSGFEGRSCRVGALSVGASARLPEYLISLQTGHAAPRAPSNP